MNMNIEPDEPPKRKTIVTGIISRVRAGGDTEYLLVASNNDFGKYTHFYYPPGGHVEEGEEIKEALVREIEEELGVTCTPLEEIAVTEGDVAHSTVHWWRCSLGDTEFTIQTDELFDVKFCTQNEMNSMNIWPATKQFFDTYIFAEQKS